MPGSPPSRAGPCAGVRAERRAWDRLYRQYNRRDYLHPDPIEVLYRYPDPRDREVVGLVASALAYGRVRQILASLEPVLNRLGPQPAAFLCAANPASLAEAFRGFRHRFTSAEELVSLLLGIRRAVTGFGSLNACFRAGLKRTDETVLPALHPFVERIQCRSDHLLPSPARGSACKRLNLYLRWMVRRDEVDPGGWEGVSPAKLIMPLDTHVCRVAREQGMTRRRAPSMRMALEVTAWFRRLAPRDPVKYDFALTRFGIRADLERTALRAALAEPRS